MGLDKVGRNRVIPTSSNPIQYDGRSKAKLFAVRKPSTGEIIATSANQIVLPKFRGPTKMLYCIHQIPPFLLQC